MVCGDLDPHGIADPLINFGQVFNGNGHHVGFCGLHLIAFLVSGGDCPGPLLIVYKTVRKRMDAICIWLFCGEIQSIKNGLDAGIVKAFPIFALIIDLCDHFVQLGKAVPHILNVSPVFRCGAGGNVSAVEAQLHGGHIVLRGTGKDGTEQNHQHDQRGKDSHNDPANLFAGLLIGKDCYRRFDGRCNGGTHRFIPFMGESSGCVLFCSSDQYAASSSMVSAYPSPLGRCSAHSWYCSRSIPRSSRSLAAPTA